MAAQVLVGLGFITMFSIAGLLLGGGLVSARQKQEEVRQADRASVPEEVPHVRA